MFRSITTLCILAMLFSMPVYGQEMQEALLSQTGLSGIGVTRVNGETYYRMQLQPDINLGKVGFGLDLVLLYNPNAEEDDDKVRTENGEKWGSSDYLRAIRYFRYGHKSPTEPIYVLYGALDYAMIGHGSIMGGYSNYDRRGLCLDLNVAEGMFGVETVLNNFADPTIFGGRLHVRPLQKKEIPLLSRLTFGATYMTDVDPVYAIMVDEEGEEVDPVAEEEVVSLQDLDPLAAFGVDVGIPILDNSALRMHLYDDLVFLKYQDKKGEDKTAKGNVAGVGMEFMGGVHFKIEYRQFGEGFRPTLFNYTYEFEKAQTCEQTADQEEQELEKGQAADENADEQENDEVQKCGLAFNAESLKGIYSQLTYSVMGKLFLTGAYEAYDKRDPNLYLQLTESGLVEKVSFSTLYTKDRIEDFGDIFDLDEKSLLTMRIGYEMFEILGNPFEIAIIREWQFRETDDEKGYETFRKTSFEVGINMQF